MEDYHRPGRLGISNQQVMATPYSSATCLDSLIKMKEVEYILNYVLEKGGGFDYSGIEMSEGLTICRLRNSDPMDFTIFALSSLRVPEALHLQFISFVIFLQSRL